MVKHRASVCPQLVHITDGSLIYPMQTAVNCDICGKKVGRKADLARHMKIHATNKEELYVH